MKKIKTCIICNSEKLNDFKAYIHPFIIERVNLSESERDIKLFICKECKMEFFDARLEDEEMKKLYSGYRNKTYQQQRQKHESAYTYELNSVLGSDIKEIKNRKNNLFRLLKKHADISKIKNILDYGGDKGQFFPDELVKADKYVYDISNIKLIDGIKKIENIEDIKNHNWNLIMCNHVLEHLPYPMTKMKFFSSISKQNTFLYIEVPYEYQGKSLRGFRKIKRFFKKPIGYYLCMHEHCNIFCKQSMEKMLDLNGFEVLSNEIVEQVGTFGKSKIISCLAKKK